MLVIRPIIPTRIPEGKLLTYVPLDGIRSRIGHSVLKFCFIIGMLKIPTFQLRARLPRATHRRRI